MPASRRAAWSPARRRTCRPNRPRGSRSISALDLFSLGSVLYAMCTGRPPFRAGTSMGVLKRVCEDTPRPIREINPEIPDWLVAMVEKLHAKDPAARFQSATEVAELLGQHLAHVQHPSVVPLPAVVKSAREPAPQQRDRERRNRWAVAAAVLVAFSAALGTAEATGVTQVRATVIRIFTPEGTLVVETDDPGVKVTVEGDGGPGHHRGGPQEIRLRPGSYRVHADQGRQVGEARPRPGDDLPRRPADRPRPPGGRARPRRPRRRPSLGRSCSWAARGRGAEVRHAGRGGVSCQPTATPSRSAAMGRSSRIRLSSVKAKRVIRAGAGYRPTIRFVRNEADTRQPVYSDAVAHARRAGFRGRPAGSEAVADRNCSRGLVARCQLSFSPARLHCYLGPGREGLVRREELRIPGLSSPALEPGQRHGWVVDNCIQVGGGATMGISLGTSKAMEVKISRLTNLANHTFQVHFGDAYIPDPGQDKNADRLHLRVSSSVLAGNFVVETVVLPERLGKNTPLGSVQYESLLQSLLKWDGEYNLYSIMPNSAKGGPHFLMATLRYEIRAPGTRPAGSACLAKVLADHRDWIGREHTPIQGR